MPFRGPNREICSDSAEAAGASTARSAMCCKQDSKRGTPRGPMQSFIGFKPHNAAPGDSVISSLFYTTTRSRDFTCAHQIANVLLEELVVAVELVVLFTDGFDSVEDCKKGLL
jgi:hypothetical protein